MVSYFKGKDNDKLLSWRSAHMIRHLGIMNIDLTRHAPNLVNKRCYIYDLSPDIQRKGAGSDK